MPYDYCRIDTPCHPDADCVNDPKNEYGYVCNCHSGWEGRTCYTLMIVDTDSAGVGAWIVAPILVILLIREYTHRDVLSLYRLHQANLKITQLNRTKWAS